MVTPKFVTVLAAVALWGWCSAAMAQSPTSQSPAGLSGSTSPPNQSLRPADAPAAVACESAGELYAVLDAADRNDARSEQRLADQNCESLANRHYEVVAEKNGIVTLRLFPHDGDRAKSRLVVTLDEMVEPDLFPGTDDMPPPLS